MTENTPAPVDPVLLQHAMAVAVAKAHADEAAGNLAAARKAAQIVFAQARRRGVPQVEALLPDGTKLGLLSIKKGAEVWTVDEDTLTIVAAGNDAGDFINVVNPRALREPQVIALLAEQFPDLVTTELTPAARERYQREWEENGGKIADLRAGERVEVATCEHLEATGEFSWRPVPKISTLLEEAIAAGVIDEWGRPVTPVLPPDADLIGQPAVDSPGQAAVMTNRDVAAMSQPAALEVADDEAARYQRAIERGDTRTGRRRSGPALDPTEEQQAVLEAWTGTGDNLTIRAGAGTGKTSTLVMLGDTARESGLYVAYNKAIAAEARRKFGGTVACSTAHALAFAAVGRDYEHRLKGPRVTARDSAKILGINEPLKLDGKMLAPEQAARLVLETVTRFKRSADHDLSAKHVPEKPGLDSDANMAILRQALMPWARKAWADLTSTTGGKLKFDHDCYLKIWQLGNPVIDAGFVLFDECQDADRVVTAVLLAQKNVRLITVGDPNQSIYEWRGAVDSMGAFGGRQLSLSQSFRFGPAVAKEANKWLELLGSDLRLTGTPRVSSMLRAIDWPDAVLCRTNGGAISEAMRGLTEGLKVAVVGGGKEIRALAEAAEALQAGRPTFHPELLGFGSWNEVRDYAENDPGGSDLQVLVRLIDEHGPAAIIAMTDRLDDERNADVVISTAHKAKGLEWQSVRIATDFRPPKRRDDGSQPDVPKPDGRLAYVAITRAKAGLDREGLAWVDRFLPGAAA